MKNTFCLTKDRYLIVSQHIGDFENLETQRLFEETLRNLKSVYRADPRILAHDLHPGYLSTQKPLQQVPGVLAFARVAGSLSVELIYAFTSLRRHRWESAHRLTQ